MRVQRNRTLELRLEGQDIGRWIPGALAKFWYFIGFSVRYDPDPKP